MVKLVLASAEQKQARDLSTWAAWGSRLTPEQYRAREDRLRGHPWARAGMQSWLLVEDDAVLASCESFRMESTLHGAPGTAHAFASVYTEPALRGNGHASQLLGAVHERLEAAGEALHGTLLFSDVGPAIYERLGYLPLPAVDRVLTPSVGAPEATVDRLVGEGELAATLATFSRPASGLVVWPTAPQLDWHLERERCYAELLGLQRPLACGAVAGAGRVLWVGNLKASSLAVLLLEAPDAQTAFALVEAARRCAAAAGLREVRLWEAPLPFAWPGDGSLGEREPRDGGLPMFRPVAPGARVEELLDLPRALWV